MPDGLPCSAARVAGEISAVGRSRIRPCGLTAALHPGPRFARLASTSLPGRSAGLRSGLFCKMQNDPAASSVSRVRSRRLPARLGKPTVKHTHMSAEAYPPDGPQISPPQGSQNFSVGAAAMERAVKCSMTRLREAMCPENFCARQAGGCAVPDPDRFGEPEFRPCHHTPVVSQVIPNIWRYEQWLTTKRTPTRPSNYSA